MITRTEKTHICQFCGEDFSSAFYSVRINHSNHCDYHNTNCCGSRFEDAKTEQQKISWLKDTIGMDDKRHSFDEAVSIFHCVIGIFKSGELDSTYPEAIKYMESMEDKLRDLYNQEVQDEIDDLKNKFEKQLSYLENKLV